MDFPNFMKSSRISEKCNENFTLVQKKSASLHSIFIVFHFYDSLHNFRISNSTVHSKCGIEQHMGQVFNSS